MRPSAAALSAEAVQSVVASHSFTPRDRIHVDFVVE
jgi:hypothetical protein